MSAKNCTSLAEIGPTSAAKHATLAEIDLASIWHPYTSLRSYEKDFFLIERGEGSYVYDRWGRRYIDAISGLWNVNIGHGCQEILDAIVAQGRKLEYFPLNGFSHEPAIRLGEVLMEIAPPGMSRAFYCNGGADANETAIKLARAYWKLKGRPGKYRVIGFSRGWHGCTYGALSASGVAEEKAAFEPTMAGFFSLPQPVDASGGDVERSVGATVRIVQILKEMIATYDQDTIAAIIAEPAQGLGGIIVPEKNFWREIKAVCDDAGILFIADEVATGFGRLGSAFAIADWGVTPDLLVCAKGITSGYQTLSAVLIHKKIVECFWETDDLFSHGYTTGGHPMACAAAVKNIELLKRAGCLDRTEREKQELVDRFRSLINLDHVGEVRGRGHMVGVELVEDKRSRKAYADARAVCLKLKDAGVLVRPIGNVVPFMPPLTTSEETVREALEIYRSVLEGLDSGAND